jgi:hypothetical protein
MFAFTQQSREHSAGLQKLLISPSSLESLLGGSIKTGLGVMIF